MKACDDGEEVVMVLMTCPLLARELPTGKWRQRKNGLSTNVLGCGEHILYHLTVKFLSKEKFQKSDE